MNILCIDYGTKRIGLAVATSPLSEPLGVITNVKNPRLSDVISDQAISEILKIVTEYQIEKIIVGISEGEMAIRSRAFIDKLSTKVTVPIEEIDETLSSVDASSSMLHMKKNKRRGSRDHIAASIILQEYLDLHQE